MRRLFRFSLGNTGTILGPLEDEVMKVLWSAGGHPIAVGDVHRAIEREGRELSYSTIKAVLSNLVTKGYLTKESKGKTNVFSPAISEAAFREMVVCEVLDALTQDYRNPMLASLVDRLGSDSASLDELEKLIALKRIEVQRHD